MFLINYLVKKINFVNNIEEKNSNIQLIKD